MPFESIKERFVYLQKLNKNGSESLINIYKTNNYNYDKNNNKLKLIHNILKNEYTPTIYNSFINYIEVDKIELSNRVCYLNTLNKNNIQNILKNYNLPQNGYKNIIIDRIIKYEFYNKVLSLSDQLHFINYKNQKNLIYIPEINFISNNYDYYDIDLVYYPYEFYNIDEYIKHLENLKHLNKFLLINEHLLILSPEWLRYIQFNLVENGWEFNSINYDEVISETVNNKYVENNNNKSITNNISTFNYECNKCDNCVICMENINKNEKCKKLICGHIFHSNCVDTWLNRVLECPICRKTIT